MVFSSILFLIYCLPVFLGVYYLLPNKYKNSWTSIFSLLFYGWGAPVFIAYALIGSLIDYFIANRIYKNKKLLTLGIVLNIAVLFYFKYSNFFIESTNFVLAKYQLQQFAWTSIALPIGISFLTFQKISYLVDVYREDAKPLKSFKDYLLFIFLFPQLIAGPILRFKDISHQIQNRVFFNLTNIHHGFFRFVIGLSKKVIIANSLGYYVDTSLATNNPPENAWLTIICYAFQIYYDFSGYSDMAIGIGKMLGFSIPENFNFPYISKSITEFWRRWHITLSNWMKDYLYIPLGGNKNGKFNTYRNLIIVFTLSGIWHGAGINFLIWGIYHGFFLTIERMFLGRILKKAKLLNVIYCFIVVTFGWVWFRIENFNEALSFFKSLIQFDFSCVGLTERITFSLILAVIFIVLGLFFEKQLNQFLITANTKYLWFKTSITFLLFVICLSELMSSNFNPFIYFKF